MIKPIDIAKKLNISTSALRHYENWGIIPAPERKPNGYRLYNEEHVAYFECIRAMSTGFGMGLVREIMPLIQQREFSESFWVVNDAQAKLHKEKLRAQQTLQALDFNEIDNFMKHYHKEWYSIGEVAKEIDVPVTTIRHWEREGLIVPERDNENGYRKYNRSHLQRVLIIRTLRLAVYNLDTVKNLLDEIDQHNLAHAKKIAADALIHLDYLITEQLRGTFYLYKLFNLLNDKRED